MHEADVEAFHLLLHGVSRRLRPEWLVLDNGDAGQKID
jgi:hypothetical protein